MSFNKNGVSFDNVTNDGYLIDRKYGHGSSIFKEVDDGLGGKEIIVHNKPREASILSQAQRQVEAAGGYPISWEISTDIGTKGIKQIFQQSNNPLIKSIEVAYVPQKTIIP